MTKPRFTDNDTAALIGRITILEELVEKLMERAEQQDGRDRQIEDQLTRVVSRSRLMTEREAAAELRVTVRTMINWRNEKPPRIPFIVTEGGNVRYRIEAIESYLNSRERGAKASLRQSDLLPSPQARTGRRRPRRERLQTPAGRR
jgi:hypothetical protein